MGPFLPENHNTDSMLAFWSVPEMHCEDVNLQKEHRGSAELILPRYHELLLQQEERKGVTGPGQYHIRGLFEKPVQSIIELPKITKSFLSQTEEHTCAMK
ncbi:sperm-tail PG-rich repeat-containing protein 2 isoform X3 [Austrofundulus limnaeus]|uniref:Sperm-tail PG-rich repeat-containing protein 2 isoform X3 n=1 Tax=Austrofundulus limnaeus TaxID=52670 RepID=A0A2I4BYM1_AUSLI|nr:PREDICTED: sperm-tail PG-rich repeat-containing protein 2-like isoform X3 [Austrofundulus limnaeus]